MMLETKKLHRTPPITHPLMERYYALFQEQCSAIRTVCCQKFALTHVSFVRKLKANSFSPIETDFLTLLIEQCELTIQPIANIEIPQHTINNTIATSEPGHLGTWALRHLGTPEPGHLGTSDLGHLGTSDLGHIETIN